MRSDRGMGYRIILFNEYLLGSAANIWPDCDLYPSNGSSFYDLLNFCSPSISNSELILVN